MALSGVHRYLIPIIHLTWTTLQETSVKSLTKTKSHLLCQGVFVFAAAILRTIWRNIPVTHTKKEGSPASSACSQKTWRSCHFKSYLNKCVGVCVRQRKDKRTYTQIRQRQAFHLQNLSFCCSYQFCLHLLSEVSTSFHLLTFPTASRNPLWQNAVANQD